MLAPRIALLWPGVTLAVVGLALTVASLLQPSGLQIGAAEWQPVFFGPIALVMSSLLLVIFLVLQVASPLRVLPATPKSHKRTRMRVLTAGAAMISAGIGVNVVLFVQWVTGGSTWENSVALAGLAQALTLSGAIWLTSAFLYWLLQRQTEYGAGRNQVVSTPTTSRTPSR